MKKLAILITAALLALIICAAAFANDTAVTVYDNAAELLFNNPNVSLNVTAEFSLDGKWFKTADVILKQDGTYTYRKLHLRSPKADGTERENGYTVVTENNVLYLMEDFTPGVYRTGFVGDRNALLRGTAESSQLISLGRALASQADLLLGEGAVTKAEDGTIRITLGDKAPALANAALNQAYMFAAKRYFNLDYDTVRTGRTYTSINAYTTMTQGILWSARNLTVRQIDIAMTTDADHMLQHAEGIIGLYLETVEDGIRQLDITFKADITDRGSTVLKKFDPKEYGVKLAPDAMNLDDFGMETEVRPENEEDAESAIQPASDEALADRMMMEAMKVWENTGFNMAASTSVSCGWDGNYYEVIFDGADDGMKKAAFFNEEGQFRFLRTEPSDWLQNMGENDAYDLETGLDEETDKKARAFFMEFLENTQYNEVDQVKDLRVQWTFEKNGNLYAMYEDKTDHGDGEGVNFVIRISPEMRIESFSRKVNG